MDLSGARNVTSSNVEVRFLPTRSWLQNLVLTPCYANEIKTYSELAEEDWTCFVLHYGQTRCASL